VRFISDEGCLGSGLSAYVRFGVETVVVGDADGVIDGSIGLDDVSIGDLADACKASEECSRGIRRVLEICMADGVLTRGVEVDF